MYLVGDFNLNILDFETNRKVKSFFNLIFQNGLNTSDKQTNTCHNQKRNSD